MKPCLKVTSKVKLAFAYKSMLGKLWWDIFVSLKLSIKIWYHCNQFMFQFMLYVHDKKAKYKNFGDRTKPNYMCKLSNPNSSKIVPTNDCLLVNSYYFWLQLKVQQRKPSMKKLIPELFEYRLRLQFVQSKRATLPSGGHEPEFMSPFFFIFR